MLLTSWPSSGYTRPMSWASSRVDNIVNMLSGWDEPNPVVARQEIMKLVNDIVERCEDVARNADNPDVAEDIAYAIRLAIL